MKWNMFFKKSSVKQDSEEKIAPLDEVYFEISSQGVRLNLNSLVSDNDLTEQVRDYKETTMSTG
ncbi:hypothetical protein [Saccharospirillum sp.]|uniref:hypothetical protein n=1 Tax=Saccharospirillum sp. TaxID=2033801 RepID=UPI0034A009B1